MAQYSQEQIYDAMRRADAAGDGEAVKALAAALKAGKSKQEINDLAAQSNLTVDQAALDANIAARDAGQQTNTFLPPTPTLADGAQNALAGAAQGVAGGLIDFPLDVASGVQKGVNALVGHGGAAAMDALRLDRAADWWSRAATGVDESLDRRVRVSDEIERASPTPEGMGGPRLAAQVLGGMMVPLGPKPTPRVTAPRNALASPAQDVIAAGEREGVRVMTSDVRPPRTMIGKLARATGERIPFAGTGGVRAAQNEERVNAVLGLAKDFGVEGAQNVIKDVADDLAKTRGGRIAALAARKDRIIDGVQGTVETPGAVAEIDRQIAKLSKLEADEVRPVIAKLQNWRDALLGKTTRIDTGLLDAGGKPIIREISPERGLRVIDDLRKLMGEAFNDPGLAAVKGMGQKAVNAIYSPLREDMGAFIRARGGQEAFQAWKRANDELAKMAGELDAGTFKRVLNDTETTPENVARLLFSKKPSDVRRLFANLSPAGQEKARAAVLHEAVTKAGGLDEISPQKFANALQAFGKTTGIIFGNDAPRIEGIVKLLRATQQASVAGAAPLTGAQNAPVIGAAALGSWLGDVGSTATVAGLAGAAARLYESRAVRNLLMGLGRAKPGSQQERTLIKRIDSALASQSGINPPAALNDNISQVGRAAASTNEENPQQ